jgi:hypothetical protein
LQNSKSPSVTPQAAAATAAASTPGAPAATEPAAAAAGSPQRWSDWVTARGWRGEAEVHRQQLLEWFGVSPAQPLKGVAGGCAGCAWLVLLMSCLSS